MLSNAVNIVKAKQVLLFNRFRSNTSFPEVKAESTLDNLALACQGCNNHKYNKTEGRDPITGDIVPLYHPRKQRWSEHFAWSDDFTLVIGLTPTGRTTVETLQLNREGVVNLCRLLYAMGEHPPAEKF